MNLGRKQSFIILTFIYIFVGAAGIVIFNLLKGEMWLSLLISDIASTVIIFVFSLIFSNSSVYDPYWSVQPIVIISCVAIGKSLSSAGIAAIFIIFLWGIRLTANWAYTFKGLKYQDWRYTMLKENTGIFYPIINFIGIHLVPTLIVYCCTLPAVYLICYDGKMNIVTVLCFLISLSGIIIQGTADCRMHIFRRAKSGGFIRTGLWKYSRHPNYLGEILMWWGIGLSTLSIMPNNYFLLIGSIANTLLFIFVSIPLADGHQARKDGFDRYKSETNMLIPFKKLNKIKLHNN